METFLIILFLVCLAVSTVTGVVLKWKQLDDQELYRSPFSLWQNRKFRPLAIAFSLAILGMLGSYFTLKLIVLG